MSSAAATPRNRLEEVAGAKSIPTDVWIDGEGRARRQTVDADDTVDLADVIDG